jgi:ketosteroid isomerase-like protein
MRNYLPAVIIMSLVATAAFAEPIEKVPVNPDTAAMFSTDSGWSHAIKARDIAGTLSVFTADVSLLPPNHLMLKGKEAVRAYYKRAFADKAFAFARQPTSVELSRDLAYTLGTYESRKTGAHGQVITERGKYVLIWKKQPDKTWKVAVDIWNSNPKETKAVE